MKALISAFALLTFVAGTALPVETYAQAAGPGHLDFNYSNDNDQEEAFLKVAPCQKEVEEIVRCSDELSQSKVSSSQRKLTQPSRYEAQWWRCARRFALPPSAAPGGSARRRQAAQGNRMSVEISRGP